MMRKTKFVLTALSISALACSDADAAMLDLAGTDLTIADVADLASYDGVTNSSATAATLTFDIAGDQAYDLTIGGNVAVVKAGAGTLSLGMADRTYTGGTTVSQGKLVLAPNNAKALGTGTVTVADGATLDLNGALSTAHAGFSSVYAAGTGADGNGALANTGAGHVNNWFTGALYLTGDLLVNNASRFDIGNIYPQGHTFRLKGTGGNGTSARVNHYYNPQGGDISIEYGQYLVYEADSFGNTADKSTVYLRGGQVSIWRDADSYFSNSPLVIEQPATIQALARNANRSIFFGKPVAVNAPLTLTRSSGTYVATVGVNNGDNALSGSAPITVGANVKFAYAIAYTSAKNTYSGPILVNANGTLCIGSGWRGACTSGPVTNNGTVAYNCNGNVTISPSMIVGGKLTLPTTLATGATLTINGSVLTNVSTTVYRHALTLDGGAKVDGGSINLGESTDYAGQLTLKNCLVTNMTAQTTIYRGVMTLGNGARWVAPSQRIDLSRQTKAEYTNVVATLNLEEGSDMTIKCLNCGQNGGFPYTNVVDGVEVVHYENMTSVVNQAGGTFRTTGYYTDGEEDGIRLAHYTYARTIWNMSGGKLIVGEPYRLNMAIVGQSTFNMSGGEVFTTELNMCGRTSGTGFGIWNMTGGELNIGSNGIRIASTKNPAYQLNLGGGVVRASDAKGFASPLRMNLTGASGTNVTFDTQASTVMLSGVLSGTGGLAKTGTGTLTLSGANTYAGATRLVDGTVAFTQAYPGGDLELPAAAPGGTSAPLLTAPGFAFASGKGVRVTEADTLDATTFGPMKTLVSSTTAISALPPLTLVSTDGTTLENADGQWRLLLMDGGKTLKFGPMRGTQILLK
ncbi:MAG: autotransporter-associated beta strand repeat-containing protein [Kiritimatiellae bacterium]|nr:autotransporter-associated beta strand repeat-containing protein [Kiritimatiellia bacterium]